ncbi:hypothetical protein P154DRAFT_521928 [Amniculicola lignicola CBS 123094]|uniref:Secreted protein n=1 Tax=Amniculicola lignicola CBS 123094 TaxID=1392246 RepID=A0A6A5WK74_9PLEO|nr:hypothetical protein P154DRAFT_521928 [Amniculicola lignicola CBS 123094]
MAFFERIWTWEYFFLFHFFLHSPARSSETFYFRKHRKSCMGGSRTPKTDLRLSHVVWFGPEF